MHVANMTLKITAAGLMLGGILFAQTTKAPAAPKRSTPATPKSARKAAPKSAAWRQECSKAGGFCIQVPGGWRSLGPIFDGAGFVVAEPDAKKSQDDWNQITAAATDMPDAKPGEERPSTDELIDIILGSPSNGITTQTLQRSRLTVAGMPAEMLKIRLRARDSQTDAIEYIALLDDGETIYSVALGCAPEDAARLEPVFDKTLHSWKAIPPTTTPEAPATPNPSPKQ